MIASRSRVRLIHWNAAEAKERVELLKKAGYQVVYQIGSELLRELTNDPPAAVIIDLSRLPTQGRDVALTIRHRKGSRNVPIVFVDGDPKKVSGIKKHVPDAVYAGWNGIRRAIERAIAHPPAEPIAPQSALAGYSGTPLPKKLGIKPGSVIALVGAPADFKKTLGPLPDGVVVREAIRGSFDLGVWFTRSRRDLDRGIEKMAVRFGQGPLWIAWPKKASSLASDLSESYVRATGLAAGLVDYKICAIDSTWSGLLFTRRKQPATRR